MSEDFALIVRHDQLDHPELTENILQVSAETEDGTGFMFTHINYGRENVATGEPFQNDATFSQTLQSRFNLVERTIKPTRFDI